MEALRPVDVRRLVLGADVGKAQRQRFWRLRHQFGREPWTLERARWLLVAWRLLVNGCTVERSIRLGEVATSLRSPGWVAAFPSIDDAFLLYDPDDIVDLVHEHGSAALVLIAVTM